MGLNIRKLRTDRGWTQQQLADRSGISRSLLTQFETGTRRPNTDRLKAMAAALSVEMRDLVSDDDPPRRGFSECEVAAWKPPEPARQNGNQTPWDPRLLAPRALNPATFAVRHGNAVNFGILPDSVLVIDLKRTPRDGDLIVARHMDADTGEAVTLLGRLLKGYLIGPRFASDPADRLRLDSRTSNIVGPVSAIVHAPEMM